MAEIALFGGTFNPIHNGHVQMIKALCQQKEVDRVLVMPAFLPPHKQADHLVGAADRLKMCEIACCPFEKARVSDLEIQKGGKSYTVETVQLLKKRYPGHHFFVCMGADMTVTLDTWYRYDLLKTLCGFYSFSRCGVASEDYHRKVEELRRGGADIRVIDTPIRAVSSTEVRQRILAGQNPEPLVPVGVAEYIASHLLYQNR